MAAKKAQKNEFLVDFLYFVAVLAIAGLLLNFLTASRPDMVPERTIVAQHTAFGLQLLGAKVEADGWSIRLSKPGSNALFEVQIIPECVGWIGIFAVSALVIAYPRVPWRKRAVGLLITLPTMYVINVLRLVTSVYSAYIGGIRTFEFTHNTLWKATLILCALGLWMVWIYFIVEENTFSDLRRDIIGFFEIGRRNRKRKGLKRGGR